MRSSPMLSTPSHAAAGLRRQCGGGRPRRRNNNSSSNPFFILSSKKGGQKVNKTSSCVYLKHAPTGIEVKCQEERSQALNRFLARRILTDKIESLVLGRESEEEKRYEKIRRQKRKRSRRAKEKMLRRG